MKASEVCYALATTSPACGPRMLRTAHALRSIRGTPKQSRHVSRTWRGMK